MKKFVFALLLVSFAACVFADGGLIFPHPPDWIPNVQEGSQNAIVAWNGREETLIISISVKSDVSTYALRVIPLPANPKIEEGTFESFDRIKELINPRPIYFPMPGMIGAAQESRGWEDYGIETVQRENIGLHDLTVVRVRDAEYFEDFVKDFMVRKGWRASSLEAGFKNAAQKYVDGGISYFVFDVIQVNSTPKAVKPVIYKFESSRLYYPLAITAHSEIGPSESVVNLYFVTVAPLEAEDVSRVGLTTNAGFSGNEREITKSKLNWVSPAIGELFKFKAFGAYAYHRGLLGSLEKDVYLAGPVEKSEWFDPLLPVAVPVYEEVAAKPFVSIFYFALTSGFDWTIKAIIFLALLLILVGLAKVFLFLSGVFNKFLSKRVKENFSRAVSGIAAFVLIYLFAMNASPFIAIPAIGLAFWIGVAVFAAEGYKMVEKPPAKRGRK